MTGESHYLAPNDIQETDRLNLQHMALREQFGTNCFAPVQHPTRILDAASGTGRWAKEVAQQFLNAQVTGIDASVPLEIQEQGPASDYTFRQANVLEPLPFPDESFDYTHMRLMTGAMPAQKWPEVVRELVRVTTKGGWVELVEAYLPIDGGPALKQLEGWGQQLVTGRGIDMTLGSHVGEFLRAAGAVDITERNEFLPVGPYGGRVGQLIGMDLMTGFRAASPVLAQGLGLNEEAVKETLQRIDAEIYGGQHQVRMPIYIAFGQRPVA